MMWLWIFPILGIGFGLLLFFMNVWMPQREKQSAQKTLIEAGDSLLAEIDPKWPTLVYFTADWCAPCKLQQTPAIEALQADMPDLQVIIVDADENREITERWGVMSLPRTFVIGRNRQVHTTNIGSTDSGSLKSQIETAMQANSQAEMQVHDNQKKGFGLPKISFRKPNKSSSV